MNQKYILSANNNSLIEEIHNTVQSIGYCIVRGLNLNHLDDSRRNKKLFDFLSQLGMLTNHKGDGLINLYFGILNIAAMTM